MTIRLHMSPVILGEWSSLLDLLPDGDDGLYLPDFVEFRWGKMAKDRVKQGAVAAA